MKCELLHPGIAIVTLIQAVFLMVIEPFLVIAVAAFYFAIVAGCQGRNFLVADA